MVMVPQTYWLGLGDLLPREAERGEQVEAGRFELLLRRGRACRVRKSSPSVQRLKTKDSSKTPRQERSRCGRGRRR